MKETRRKFSSAPDELAELEHYHQDPKQSLSNPTFYTEISEIFRNSHPLIAYRARLLGEALCPTDGQNKIKNYVERHQKTL